MIGTTSLSLPNNQLSGPIPSELGNLTNLTYLELGNNQLAGDIPPELGNLSHLTEVDLSGNPNLCMPSALKDWNFYNTEGVAKCSDTTALKGTDRAALVALYNATDGDNWTGNTNWLSDKPIGEWYGIGANLQERVFQLYLHENQLSGPIPAELGNLANLRRLALHKNQLSGPIPSELGKLTNLESLALHENQLSGGGPIPSELGNLTYLTRLGVSRNQLTGPIPSELGNLSNLTILWLHNNQLTGPIPPELGNLTNLVDLRLSNNPNLCMPSALIDWKFYNTEGVAKCSE